MNLAKALIWLRQEVPVSTLFPITHLNSPSVFESKQGYLGATLKVEGIPYRLAEDETLNEMHERVHQALLTLDERFIVYVTLHRQKEALSLSGDFKSAFAKQVNEKYLVRFKNKSLYKNALYLTIVLKGDTSSKLARSLSFLTKLKESASLYERTLRRDANLTLLLAKIAQLKTSLAPFKPHLLGEKDSLLGFSELLRFLALIPNGGKDWPFRPIKQASVIAKSFIKALEQDCLYPQGHLGHYLSQYRLFFGQDIQFQGATPEDKRFASLLTIKQYSTETASITLAPLLELDAEFILTHSFTPIPRDIALTVIDTKRGKLLNAKDLSTSQIADLSALEDGIASQTMRLGSHHNSLMLLTDNQEALNQAVREAIKAYAQSGTVLIKETLGAEAAFWAQLPTNHHLIARTSPITSHNFADYCSLHNEESGFSNGNHLGEAVTLVETPSKTPVYFNYHSKSSKTNPAKGHTAIYGATNAGKNTLVAFLDAQMGRYNHRSFFLDRDEASKLYVLANPNSYYTVIVPGHSDSFSFNPFQLPDSPENRTFLKSWFAELIKKPHEEELPSELLETLGECVNYAFEQLEKRYRNLSTISRCLPQDFARWPELRRWLKPSAKQLEPGDYHWLFDNERDSLELHWDKAGFDITYLMDEVSNSISTPVYLYLLHRMRQSLDGRLTSFILDEFWQVLNSPFWLKHLKSWLATIRKKNGHFIFMTQTPESVVNSPIAAEIITNLATSIYFPNPLATEAVYQERLNLTPVEFQTIKRLTPESRFFLYKQEHTSLLCKLDLSDLRDEIRVFSGNKASVKLLDSLIQEVGTNPSDWLPLFYERSRA